MSQQFSRLLPLLPTDGRGNPRVDDRRLILGILPVLRSRYRWKNAPACCGPRKPLYNHFVRSARKGVWERSFIRVSEAGGPPPALMLDAAHAEAHCCTAGGKGAEWNPKPSGDSEAGRRRHFTPQWTTTDARAA